MKKLISILMLSVAVVTVHAQGVNVLGKIVPNSVIDTYPTHVDSLGRGGFVAVSTWQERNSIPTPRRKAGMMVSVKSATVDSLYRLGTSLSNSSWTPFVTSTPITNLNQIATRSYNDLQDKPTIPTNVASLTADNTFTGSYSRFNSVRSNDLQLTFGATSYGRMIPYTGFTTQRTWSFPDKDGIVAMLSDLATKGNLLGGNQWNGEQQFTTYSISLYDPSNISQRLGLNVETYGFSLNSNRYLKIRSDEGVAVQTGYGDIQFVGDPDLSIPILGTNLDFGASSPIALGIASGADILIKTGIGGSEGTKAVKLIESDLELESSNNNGIILKSPNGSRFKITVSDSGTLIVSPVI